MRPTHIDEFSALDEVKQIVRASAEDFRLFDAEEAERAKVPFHRYLPFPRNPHRDQIEEWETRLTQIVSGFAIKAFHYARLTDDEADHIRASGMVLSSVDALRDRLARRVAANELTKEEADQIFGFSAYRHRGFGERLGQIWFTSREFDPGDEAVSILLETWGGEAVSRGADSHPLRARLTELGRPMVVEAAIPITLAQGLAGTIAWGLLTQDMLALDVRLLEDLPAEYVVDVRTI